MTYTQEFDESRLLITITATGTDDMKSSLESMRALRLDPCFRLDYGILLDLRNSQHIPNQKECLGIGTAATAFFAGQKIALVVAEPDVENLIELGAIMTSRKLNINVFNDAHDAERWLMSPAARQN